MIHSLSNHIVHRISQQLDLEEDKIALYVFGVEMLIVSLIKWGGLLGIGALLGVFKEAFLFIITFTILRNRAGGIHSESFIVCFGITTILMLLSIYFIQMNTALVGYPLILLLFSLSTILVFIYAPVDTPNKPLNEEEKRIYKKQSRFIVLLLALLTLSTCYLKPGFLPYGTLVSLSCFLEAITLPLGVGIIKKI